MLTTAREKQDFFFTELELTTAGAAMFRVLSVLTTAGAAMFSLGFCQCSPLLQLLELLRRPGWQPPPRGGPHKAPARWGGGLGGALWGPPPVLTHARRRCLYI